MPLISQTLAIIPRDSLRTLVDKFKSDKRCKGFDSWTHVSTMVRGQLAGAESLRDSESQP
ncbi:MAG: DUF4372 domain-containing protein [Deltaproteobacteria bacterium]|nr:DUF4372 domain-containing protein [Deltaproteobacteria bacterium]